MTAGPTFPPSPVLAELARLAPPHHGLAPPVVQSADDPAAHRVAVIAKAVDRALRAHRRLERVNAVERAVAPILRVLTARRACGMPVDLGIIPHIERL